MTNGGDFVGDSAGTAAFGELLARIRAGAPARDAERTLPYEEITELARGGFGALRLPTTAGGAGLTVRQFTERLMALARADSNLVQIWRNHYLFTESLLFAPESDTRTQILASIAAGCVIGGGATERGTTNGDRFSTAVSRSEDGRLAINGRKYYSTGSLFADWFWTLAEGENGSPASYLIRTDAPGLVRVDDWDGFGQRLTASGTTILDDVEVDEPIDFGTLDDNGGFVVALAQHFHLVALAGIARSAHDEVVDYVRSRERYFSNGTRKAPREDPIVQEIVGELSAAAYLAETLVRQNAGELDSLADAIADGSPHDGLDEHVELQVYRAQYQVVTTVLAATSRIFDVGGASALSRTKNWDRFWRNARTLASHNPISYRLTAIGAAEVTDTSPYRAWFSGVDLSARESRATPASEDSPHPALRSTP